MFDWLNMKFKQAAKLVRVLRNSGYRQALAHGVAAATEHEAVLRAQPFEMVIDIGANKGQFSLVAKGVFPAARIIAFEPMKDAAEKYRAVFSSCPDVNLHEVAIGPQRDEKEMYISKRDDSSSLLPITKLQEKNFPGTGLERIDTIKTVRLADLVTPEELARPALLKIDVQGYELDVLKGCEELLKQIGKIIVECSFVELYEGQALAHEVVQYLHEAGFVLSGIYNISYDRDGLPVQADFIFLPIESHRVAVG